MPIGVYVRTEKQKRRIREFGQKYGFKKGYTPWNKGRKCPKISKARKGQMSWNKGKKLSKEHKRKISKACKGICLGENHPAWKGGKVEHNGYILIHKPEHPFCTGQGYTREHRLVVEAQIGRYLTPSEECHHLGERDDNRPSMLMAFINQSAHQRFHKNPENVNPKEIIFDGRNLTNKKGEVSNEGNS